jgi:hypothetical protein
MRKGELVLVRCSFSRGGFPSELVFHVPVPGGGAYEGVAPRNYCFGQDRKPLTAQLKPGEAVEGYVAGLLLGERAGASLVNLPDNDVYELPDAALVTNGELSDVSLQP